MTGLPILSLCLVSILAGSDVNLARTFNGHADDVTGVAFSPDRRQVVSASRDGTVRLWDAESGREIRRFDAVRGQAQRVHFSPDGRQVASVAENGSASLWETDTGREVRRFSLNGHVQAIAFCSESGHFRLLSGARGGLFDLWDLATGQPIRSFEQPIDSVTSLDLSADGRRALAAGDNFSGGAWIAVMQRLWEVESGTVVLQRALGGHSVSKAFLSPDGRLILSETPFERDRLLLLDERCSLIWAFPWPGPGLAMAVFSPDQRYALAVSDPGIPYLLDTKSGRARIGLGGAGGGVTSAAFSSDGAQILLGRENRVELWRVPRFPDAPAGPGDEVHRLIHDGFVYSGAFSPDGRQALTSSSDGTVRLWDVEQGRQLKKLQAEEDWDVVNALAWSPDGRHALLATGGYRGANKATLWDVEAWKEIWTRYGNDASSVAFSPDGRRALLGTWTGYLSYYDEIDRQQSTGLEEPSGRPIRVVAFSPDGRRAVFTAGCDGLVVGVADLESENGSRDVTLLPHKHVREAVFFPDDNNRILSAGWDGTLRLWDLAGRTPVRIIRTPEPVTAVAMVPDGRRAVLGGENGTIRLWNLESGAQVQAFTGHGDEVTSVDVSPDGRYALSTSYDFTARLWELPPAEPEQAPQDREASWHQYEVVHCDVELLAGRAPAHVRVKDANVKVMLRHGGGEVVITDMMSGREVRLETRDMEILLGKDDLTLRPSGDGFTLARRGVVIAEVERRRPPTPLPGHRERPERTAARIEQVRLFECRDELPATVGDLDFSPDGALAVSALWNGYVRLWDVEAGQQLRRFDDHYQVIAGGAAKVNAARFSPDGSHIASGGDDRKVLLWQVETGKPVRRFPHDAAIEAVVFSSKGDRLLTADESGRVRLWNVADGESVAAFEHPLDSVYALGMSPDDGRAIVAGLGRDPGKFHGVLRVWDLETGKALFEFEYPERRVTSVAGFAGDGRSVLAEDPMDPYSLVMWDLESGKKTGSFLQPDYIYSLAVSPDGRRVLVGGVSSMQLFELESQRHLAGCTYTGPFRCVAFSRDGRYALSGNNWQMLLWRLP